MKQYLDALNYILENGEDVNDRTGTGTRTVFGYQMRFPLSYSNFPAVTTKRLAFKSVVGELLWFLEGSTDERRLAEITFEKDRTQLSEKNTIWTANANKQAKELGYVTDDDDTYKKLGPVYGFQWRNFDGAYYNGAPHMRGTDQISWIINEIKTNPDSRRIILSAWNPNQLDKMTLPPCHTLAQFRVMNGKLSCQMYQRSADMFLGVPFNIASYSLLTHMLAQICNLKVGEFVWTGGDCHVYNNHMPQVLQQLSRKPHKLPQLEMPQFTSLEEVLETSINSYALVNYDPMPTIKAEMSV
jgi:thymidylate synthase